jgi:chromosome segregation ATPase
MDLIEEAQGELDDAIARAEAKSEELRAALERWEACIAGFEGALDLMPDRYREMVAHCEDLGEKADALWDQSEVLDDAVTAARASRDAVAGDPTELRGAIDVLDGDIDDVDDRIAALALPALEAEQARADADADLIEQEIKPGLQDELERVKALHADDREDEEDARRTAETLKAKYVAHC